MGQTLETISEDSLIDAIGREWFMQYLAEELGQLDWVPREFLSQVDEASLVSVAKSAGFTYDTLLESFQPSEVNAVIDYLGVERPSTRLRTEQSAMDFLRGLLVSNSDEILRSALMCCVGAGVTFEAADTLSREQKVTEDCFEQTQKPRKLSQDGGSRPKNSQSRGGTSKKRRRKALLMQSENRRRYNQDVSVKALREAYAQPKQAKQRAAPAIPQESRDSVGRAECPRCRGTGSNGGCPRCDGAGMI